MMLLAYHPLFAKTEPPDYFLFYSDLWWLCLSKSEWAAWVQAVGSLLALIVAVWVVRFQLRRTRLHAADDAAVLLEARAKLLDYAAISISEMEFAYGSPKNLSSPDPLDEHVRNLREIVQSFQLIGYETVTTPTELEILMNARRCLKSSLEDFDRVNKAAGDRWIALLETTEPINAHARAYRDLAQARRRSAC